MLDKTIRQTSQKSLCKVKRWPQIQSIEFFPRVQHKMLDPPSSRGSKIIMFSGHKKEGGRKGLRVSFKYIKIYQNIFKNTENTIWKRTKINLKEKIAYLFQLLQSFKMRKWAQIFNLKNCGTFCSSPNLAVNQGF